MDGYVWRHLFLSAVIMDVNVLELPLKLLKVPGVDPRDNSWFSVLGSFVCLATGILVCVNSVMEIYYREWTITEIVPVIETFMATMEVVTLNLENKRVFFLSFILDSRKMVCSIRI